MRSPALFALLAMVAGAVGGTAPATIHITESLVTEALGFRQSLDPHLPWPAKRRAVAAAVMRWSEATLAAEQGANASSPRPDPRYAYFRWLPQYLGSIAETEGGAGWHGSNACFKDNSLSVVKHEREPDGALTLEFKFKGKTSWIAGCSDTYMLATVDGLAFATLRSDLDGGTHRLKWNASTATGPELDAVRWDLRTKGIRLFRLITDRLDAVADIAKTAALFVSEAVNPVPKPTAKANVDFLSTYTPFPITPRSAGPVPFEPSEIRSGDFFGILRLDGLDPMLAWAMGSSTGHTTVALWNRSTADAADDYLMVCESTVKDVFWPVNGVQCAPYPTWIALAEAAGFNVVLLPLDDAASARFNETKAMAWVESVVGLNYGYSVLFWGWIDTLADNYPCTAPDFKDTANSTCLSWDFIEVLMPLVDKLVPALKFGETFVKEALAHRLGVADTMWNSTIPQIYRVAGRQGVDIRAVPTMIEKDEWRYHSTRYGKPVDDAKSMVCCVFVCNMWKEAGVFSGIDSDLQCGELTNLDVYSTAVFRPQSPSKRPAKCISADPSNPNCQIMGNFTLRLNRVNSKPAARAMAERCPTATGCQHGWRCPDQPAEC